MVGRFHVVGMLGRVGRALGVGHNKLDVVEVVDKRVYGDSF